MPEISLPTSHQIKKKYNHLGFKSFNLIGIFILSMFLAYSIEYFYIELFELLRKYFPTFTYINTIDTFLTDFNIKKYFINNFLLLTVLLFGLQVVFFQNDKLNVKKYKTITFLDQTFQKLALLIPLKQFATFMLISHANHVGVETTTFNSDFAMPILLLSFILSTIVISVIPQMSKAIYKWRRNHLFALNSGLIFHYSNIEDLELDYEFTKLIKSLGEIKIIKISGVTGKHTFVSNESYMHRIFDSTQLKKSNKPKIKILLSKKDSKGLASRAKSISTHIHMLNNEIDETVDFIKNNEVLQKHSKIKHYTTEPKYKMILIEGSRKSIVLLQAYLDKNNILDEQVYIYEDKEGTSIYKILNEAYEDLYRMIK